MERRTKWIIEVGFAVVLPPRLVILIQNTDGVSIFVLDEGRAVPIKCVYSVSTDSVIDGQIKGQSKE